MRYFLFGISVYSSFLYCLHVYVFDPAYFFFSVQSEKSKSLFSFTFILLYAVVLTARKSSKLDISIFQAVSLGSHRIIQATKELVILSLSIEYCVQYKRAHMWRERVSKRKRMRCRHSIKWWNWYDSYRATALFTICSCTYTRQLSPHHYIWCMFDIYQYCSLNSSFFVRWKKEKQQIFEGKKKGNDFMYINTFILIEMWHIEATYHWYFFRCLTI